MPLAPYLFFEGRCAEAIEFYKKALGAEVKMSMLFKDCPDETALAKMPPEALNRIMHAEIKIGDSVILMSDGHANGKPVFQGFAINILVNSADEADKFFNAVGEGGKIAMPLQKTFYSPRFGMVTDRFGVLWMVYMPQKN